MNAKLPVTHDPALENPPQAETVERCCWELILATDRNGKRLPPPVQEIRFEEAPAPRRLLRPGRPTELRILNRSPRTPKPEALQRPEARAGLFHTFLHHEVQAAELFAWAILAFPETPQRFRAGLLRLAGEELAHAALYEEHLSRLGFAYGDFPVRDWFWERARTESAASFVAFQGLGLEGANLEHSARFAAMFHAAGDAEGAAILEQVEREEVSHVAFAVRWFETLTGSALDYDSWCAALPEPVTPSILRGLPLNRSARLKAGFPEALLDHLAAAPPSTRSSS